MNPTTGKFANSLLFSGASFLLWVFIWWPFARMAHNAFFNYFYTTEVPPKFLPSSPILVAALLFVLFHALISPLVWFILGRVFYLRGGTLAFVGVLAYLLQGGFIFFTLGGQDLWLNDPNSSIFGLWGLLIWAIVLGLNLISAILAPLVIFASARIKFARSSSPPAAGRQ